MLLENQTLQDCPDIIARAFNMKGKLPLEAGIDYDVFGNVEVYDCVMEFQKRGLPHIYYIIFMDKHSEGSFRSPSAVKDIRDT